MMLSLVFHQVRRAHPVHLHLIKKQNQRQAKLTHLRTESRSRSATSGTHNHVQCKSETSLLEAGYQVWMDITNMTKLFTSEVVT